jgi:hypothetical protein
MTRVQIQNYAGVPIRSFDDWESYALPPARKELHWKPDRSACELGRILRHSSLRLKVDPATAPARLRSGGV